MLKADIAHYGLRIHSMQQETQEFPGIPGQVSTTITIQSMQNAGTTKLEQFASDITVMNSVRSSDDPAVLEAYQQLLTVMALTKGRNFHDPEAVEAS